LQQTIFLPFVEYHGIANERLTHVVLHFGGSAASALPNKMAAPKAMTEVKKPFSGKAAASRLVALRAG